MRRGRARYGTAWQKRRVGAGFGTFGLVEARQQRQDKAVKALRGEAW